jgi:hypothetical protein
VGRSKRHCSGYVSNDFQFADSVYTLTQGDAVLFRDLLTRAKVVNHVITVLWRVVLDACSREQRKSEMLLKFDDFYDAERVHTDSICNFPSTHESI